MKERIIERGCGFNDKSSQLMYKGVDW